MSTRKRNLIVILLLAMSLIFSGLPAIQPAAAQTVTITYEWCPSPQEASSVYGPNVRWIGNPVNSRNTNAQQKRDTSDVCVFEFNANLSTGKVFDNVTVPPGTIATVNTEDDLVTLIVGGPGITVRGSAATLRMLDSAFNGRPIYGVNHRFRDYCRWALNEIGFTTVEELSGGFVSTVVLGNFSCPGMNIGYSAIFGGTPLTVGSYGGGYTPANVVAPAAGAAASANANASANATATNTNNVSQVNNQTVVVQGGAPAGYVPNGAQPGYTAPANSGSAAPDGAACGNVVTEDWLFNNVGGTRGVGRWVDRHNNSWKYDTKGTNTTFKYPGCGRLDSWQNGSDVHYGPGTATGATVSNDQATFWTGNY